ncbi:MAG: murein biosynthesis integral membrane protein MurJ [Chloroflexota bacterium]|nr:murein biosynthesis integral membrane protein MurJ [Chloroflexota bacterium]
MQLIRDWDPPTCQMIATRRQIARAAGLVSILFAVSRLLGLVREIVIGAQFGTGADLDAYLAAFRLPDMIFYLVAGGALASAFIPTFTSTLSRDSDPRHVNAWRLASAVTNLVLIISTGLAILAAILAEWLVAHVIAPGFDPAQRILTAELMRIMLIAPILFGVSGIIMGVLNSFQHFLAPALAPIMYNLAIILAALFLAPTMGVRGLALGVVAGAAAHLLVQLSALLQRHPIYQPILGLKDPDVREVGRLMGPRVLGLAAVQINFLVNANLASNLSEGSISALNYAWLMMLLPQGIIAQGIATAVFPTLSAQAAQGMIDSLRSTLNGVLRAMLWLTVPAAAGLVILRIPLITVLLQRGEFGAESTQLTAYALAFFALGLVAHSVLEILVRAFYALHDTWTPVRIGLIAMALNIVLSLLLIRPLAHGGLALANTLATTLETLALLWLLKPRLNGLGGRRLVITLGRSLLATVVMSVVLLWLIPRLAGFPAWLIALAGIVIGGLVFGAVAFLLARQEIADLIRRRRTPAISETANDETPGNGAG